jgi:hypothetical protein
MRYQHNSVLFKMTMLKTISIFVFFTILSMTVKAQLKIADLLKIYNSGSINLAYSNISALTHFKGDIKIDSISKDSMVIGTLANDTIKISRIKSKSKIELTTYNKSLFQSIKDQAELKLHFSGNYARGSEDVSRKYYVFSDKQDMKIGDLWFILTKCQKKNKSGTFYEIKLKTYDEQ